LSNHNIPIPKKGSGKSGSIVKADLLTLISTVQKSEQSAPIQDVLYLIGSHLPIGVIWRLGLFNRAWRKLFTNKRFWLEKLYRETIPGRIHHNVIVNPMIYYGRFGKPIGDLCCDKELIEKNVREFKAHIIPNRTPKVFDVELVTSYGQYKFMGKFKQYPEPLIDVPRKIIRHRLKFNTILTNLGEGKLYINNKLIDSGVLKFFKRYGDDKRIYALKFNGEVLAIDPFTDDKRIAFIEIVDYDNYMDYMQSKGDDTLRHITHDNVSMYLMGNGKVRYKMYGKETMSDLEVPVPIVNIEPYSWKGEGFVEIGFLLYGIDNNLYSTERNKNKLFPISEPLMKNVYRDYYEGFYIGKIL
jgi:hypothetical protein